MSDTHCSYQLLLERSQALLRQAPVPGRDNNGGEQGVPPDVARRVADGTSPLRAWREFRGFSQAQLALLTGISRAYLTQIETGERTMMSYLIEPLHDQLMRAFRKLLPPAECGQASFAEQSSGMMLPLLRTAG